MCVHKLLEDSLSNTQAFPIKLKHLNAVCPRLATNIALPLEVTVFLVLYVNHSFVCLYGLTT